MPLLTPAQTFARIEKAQTAWTRGGATVTVSNISGSGANSAQFRLDLDGAGGAALRIKSPSKKGLVATDQAFFLRGNRVVGVDYDAREVIVRPVPSRGALGLRLTAILGGIDDSVDFLLTPATRARYLDPLKSLSGWKVTKNGLVRQTSAVSKSSFTRIDLDASGKVTGLHVALPNSRLDWTIKYGPNNPPPLPRNLRPVDAFTARPLPPKYLDATAQRVAQRMLRASSGLQSAIVSLDRSATLWVSGSQIRYESGGSGFAYDGRNLTIKTPGVAYKGRTSRGSVIDYVAGLMGTTDPMVRSILVRTPIYGEAFTPDAKVRVVGTGAVKGTVCDILSIDSPHYRTSMFVRKSDGLPASIETETLDRNGNSVSRTYRELAWSSVGKPLTQSLFALHLRTGQTVLVLPKRPTSGSASP